MADYSSSPYYGAAVAAAQKWGVPTDLFVQQIGAESGFNPYARNASGAYGIAQIMPSTAANPGYGISSVDPSDPLASLDFAAHYDAVLAATSGSWLGALQGYTGSSNPYSGNSGVQSVLGGMGLDMFTGGVGDITGMMSGVSPSTGQGVSGGDKSIDIISAMKRVGLFVMGVVFIGAGLYLFGAVDPKLAKSLALMK